MSTSTPPDCMDEMFGKYRVVPPLAAGEGTGARIVTDLQARADAEGLISWGMSHSIRPWPARTSMPPCA
jgi:hypothetical protein